MHNEFRGSSCRKLEIGMSESDPENKYVLNINHRGVRTVEGKGVSHMLSPMERNCGSRFRPAIHQCLDRDLDAGLMQLYMLTLIEF